MRVLRSQIVVCKNEARPYCQCWYSAAPLDWRDRNCCSCGEDVDYIEWRWEAPDSNAVKQVIMSEDQKQVTFHPYYSSGTAAVRGNAPLLLNYHYYWEVKMLSEAYGTDIMVGIGSNKVNVPATQYKFTSLLGQDTESYGLSYMGPVRHNSSAICESAGFCRGSIIGVRLDLWAGTLEFYINREPQGVSLYNLRRHDVLFPMICSTAAQSTMRLIYASSWRASLLVDAAKTLAYAVRKNSQLRVPPGLWHTLKLQFWLTLPMEGCVSEEKENGPTTIPKMKKVPSVPLSPGMKRRHWLMLPNDSATIHHNLPWQMPFEMPS